MSTSPTRLLSFAAAFVFAAAALAWAPAWHATIDQPEEEETSEQPAADPAEAPSPSRPVSPAADPEVDRILQDLERSADRAANTRIAPPAPALETSPKLIREGTFLRSRRGRVVRNDAGEWVFRFDSDGQSPITDPPMVLMPCQALMAMEAIAQRHGDAATFTVSGTVYVYHNRNYLLPTFYVVNRATDEVLPAQ